MQRRGVHHGLGWMSHVKTKIKSHKIRDHDEAIITQGKYQQTKDQNYYHIYIYDKKGKLIGHELAMDSIGKPKDMCSL